MRNQSAKTPLAVTVFLALLSFGVAQQKATSAAEAGISQSDDSRAKALRTRWRQRTKKKSPRLKKI